MGMKKINVRAALLAFPLAAALALAGCGGNGASQTTGGDEEKPAPTEQATESVDENGVTTLGDNDDDDDDDDDSNDKGGSVKTANKAIDTAEKAVKGSKAIAIDFDDDNEWDVDVIANGQVTELKISGNGTKVLEKDKDDDVDSDKRNAADAVRQTLKQAIASATRHTPGTVDEAELESDGGVHWEVKVYPKGKSDSVKLKVHHRSGDIIK